MVLGLGLLGGRRRAGAQLQAGESTSDCDKSFEDARSTASSPTKYASWERAWEMKRVIKATEEIMEREEVERTKAALQLKAQSKQEQASRRRADKSETLRIQRESYNLVKAQQQKVKEQERAELRKEYERAVTQRKKEEERRRAALAKEREQRRAEFVEKRRANAAVAEEAKRKEQEDIRWRHEATRRKLEEAEKERMEKVEKNKKEVEAAKERRRLSPSGPTLATTLKAKEAAAAKQGGGRR